MGMFDSLYVVDENTAEQITCAAGHAQLKRELQTKSFDCDMDDYYVARVLGPGDYDAELFKVERRGDVKREQQYTILPSGVLVIERETYAKPCPVTKSALVYADCKQCDPIIIEKDAGHFGRIQERYVDNRWELFFEDGALVRVVAVERQSREELRAELLKNGCEHVLDDDDRVAKRHLELLREGRTIF